MLYLFNESVMEIDGLGAMPVEVARRIAATGLDEVLGMVADAVRRDSKLAQSPAKARRVIQMLLIKAPQMNAALILPSHEGQPGEARLSSIGLDAIHDLHGLQASQPLTLDLVRRLVWTAPASAEMR